MDVSQDEVVPKLQQYFKDIAIDVLIHNAGAYGPYEIGFQGAEDMYASQTLENVTIDRIRGSLEINTLGPLRVTQALLPNLRQSTTISQRKIIIISSAMGSIADNTSGGRYGYRTAKAGVNMIGKSLAEDLKDDQIAVGMIHPGFVLTGFDSATQKQASEDNRRQGQQDVEPSARGVLQAIDMVTMETTGQFLHGNYGNGVKNLPW